MSLSDIHYNKIIIINIITMFVHVKRLRKQKTNSFYVIFTVILHWGNR